MINNSNNNNNNNNSYLIIISGFAGVGKSTIGKKLSKNLNYTYIDKDTLYNDFVNVMLELNGINSNNRECNFYTEKIKPLEYKTLSNVILDNLYINKNIIAVAPFITQLKNDEWFQNIKKIYPLITIIKIWIVNNPDKNKERILNRNFDRDQNKINNWYKYIKSIDNIYEKELCNSDLYVFDNSENNFNVINKITCFIENFQLNN